MSDSFFRIWFLKYCWWSALFSRHSFTSRSSRSAFANISITDCSVSSSVARPYANSVLYSAVTWSSMPNVMRMQLQRIWFFLKMAIVLICGVARIATATRLNWRPSKICRKIMRHIPFGPQQRHECTQTKCRSSSSNAYLDIRIPRWPCGIVTSSRA